MIKVAIDYAKSMGVAWMYPGGTQINFATVVGNQFEHLHFVKSLLHGWDCELFVEELNFFRNAKTVRSLLLRTGFVVYSVSKNPTFISTSQPRKHLGCKNKKEVFDLLKNYGARNTDESDAIAILLYASGLKPEGVTFYGYD